MLVRAGDRGVAQEVLAGEGRAELAVDLLQLADRRRLDVEASRVTRELLQRSKLRESRTEPDREDPDVRRSRRRGRAFKGLVGCAVPGGAMLLTVGEQDQRSRFDLCVSKEFQRAADRVVDVRAEQEDGLLGEGQVDLRLIGCKWKRDRRRDVVRDDGELLLSLSLGRKGPGCRERRLARAFLPCSCSSRSRGRPRIVETCFHSAGVTMRSSTAVPFRTLNRRQASASPHAAGSGCMTGWESPTPAASVSRTLSPAPHCRECRNEADQRDETGDEETLAHCNAAPVVANSGRSGFRIANSSFGMATPRFSNL